jgi:hypothetical protein
MVENDSRPERGTGRVRADGRRQLLVYLDPDVIKDTKKSALDLDTTASAIVEEALREWQHRYKTEREKS